MLTNINYKHKYEKYKTKYLNKISLKGGSLSINKSNSPINQNKLLGCLYGASVGDAFGSRYEFLESEQASLLITKDINNSKTHLPPILGGGPFKTNPGQISDDSEMMLCLLKSIYVNKSYNQKDVANNYITWFNTEPIDVGKTISRALFTRQKSVSNVDMVRNSRELNNTSLSNGSLMRIAPLAILALKLNLTSSQLRKIVNQECDLTHPNPIIKDASFIYILAIIYSILGYSKKKIYIKLLKQATEPRVKILVRDSQDSPTPTYIIDDLNKEVYIQPDSKRYQGYFGISFQNALYELFKGVDFNISTVDIAKRGGDVDTNCAIAGALLGAYYSIDNIDKKWVSTVREAKYSRIDKYPDYKVTNIEKYINF
jgi:ADP-ribosyl-[dinitrogen reductase] hydrolase